MNPICVWVTSVLQQHEGGPGWEIVAVCNNRLRAELKAVSYMRADWREDWIESDHTESFTVWRSLSPASIVVKRYPLEGDPA